MHYPGTDPVHAVRRRRKPVIATVLHGCALSTLLLVPDTALAMIVLGAAELEALDQAMVAGADQPPVEHSDPLSVPSGDISEAGGDEPYAEPSSLSEVQDLPDDGPSRARDYASFGDDLKAIKWEFAAIAGYYTAINAPKLLKDSQWPTFQNEGWFGRSTSNLGVDKLAHAYSTYVVSELLYARLKRKTGNAPGIELTAAALASIIMLGTEAFDSIEPTSGWSWQDVAFNSLGAGLSIVRNSVPGLDRKLDYRLMIQPNENIYNLSGKEHFRQQRYLFALKLSGFRDFEDTPLRYIELHLGYRADDFLNEDRAAGVTPKRHVFVGLGINLRELAFRNSRSRAGRAAGEVLDYFQPPFTAIHQNLTQ